jgi:hypothetical protein
VLYVLAGRSIFISVPAGSVVYLAGIILLRAVDAEEWRLARNGLLSRFTAGRAPTAK